MCSNWPETKIQSIQDFANWLAETSQKPERVYRGQADSGWHLQPSLDRNVQKTDRFEALVQKEKKYIKDFCEKAHKFLGRLEQEHLKKAHSLINRMTVMQHFGAPTRLLDWTLSGAIAAYFTCIDIDNREGTIWWMKESAVVNYVHLRWDKWGFIQRDADKQIIFGDKIFERNVDPFVTMIYLRIPFSRAQAQRGLFTLGSRTGLAHDVQLKAQLRDEPYERVVIPANLKAEVIEYLARMGIDAISLQHTGADRVGLRMAWDREHRDKP